MAFFLTELFVLLIIIGLFLILSAVWPPDSPWAPWWQMPDDVIEKMCKLAKITSKDTIYDLGCGTGKALIYAAKEYGAKGVGIEIDPLRFTLAKWNIWKTRKNYSSSNPQLAKGKSRSIKKNISLQTQTIGVTILKKNFFDVDISGATVIFVYLIPKALGRLLPKLLKELKPGTKIISYIYDFPDTKEKKHLRLRQYDKQKKIYIYSLYP